MAYRTRFYGNTELWKKIVPLLKDKGANSVWAMLNNTGESESKTVERSGNEYKVKLDATPIQTEQELIEACKIDLDKWEIQGFRCSTWNQNSKTDGLTQLFSVRASFVVNSDDYIKTFIKSLESGKFKLRGIKGKRVETLSKYCAIINLYDAHLDKVTRFTETGESSNILKNCQHYKQAFSYLLNKAGNPSKLIIPIGNDLFNINDARGTTKKGTHQDTVLHHADTFEIILNVICDTINEAAKVAPVSIPMIAGNHDEDMIHLLGVVLNRIYANHKGVSIDYTRRKRKYTKYGNNLFMFAHGDKMKSKVKNVPLIIAEERPKDWATTRHRYAFFGDIHHQNEYQFLRGKDYIGVKVKFLRAICSQDVWHDASGYIGVPKTAELFRVSECGKEFETVEYSF